MDVKKRYIMKLLLRFWRKATVVHLWLGWKGFLSASCRVWVCIDSSDGKLAEEMASFVSYGSVMANHLLGAVNWQTPILVCKHPWGFYWLPLQLLHLMWLAQWGPKVVKVLQKKKKKKNQSPAILASSVLGRIVSMRTSVRLVVLCLF